MEIGGILRDRRTVHDFEPREVPAQLLDQALESALAAPNHRMTEPWRFVRVGPQTRAQLCEISLALKAGDAELRQDVIDKTKRKMLNPELLVACRVRGDDLQVEREDYAAIACAIQNLMLSLWAQGVSSKWSTGAVTTDPRTYEALGVDEAEQEIVGFIWVGYAVQVLPKAKRRKALQEVVRQVP